MSRQRLRTGMLEGSTSACAMCQGTGIVRSIESVALDVLRSLEDRLITSGAVPLVATTAVDVALYILNQKRAHLEDIERRYHVPIRVTADEDLHVSQFVIDRSSESDVTAEPAVVQMDWTHHPLPASTSASPSPAPSTASDADSEGGRRRSRRRRRKRRGPGEQDADNFESAMAEAETDDSADHAESDDHQPEEPSEASSQARKPRRRGRRGGRRGRAGQGTEQMAAEGGAERTSEERQERHERADAEPEAKAAAPANSNGREARSKQKEEAVPEQEREEPAKKTYAVPIVEKSTPPDIRVESDAKPEDAPRRRGWWQR
jgi:ribonuclease E